VLILLVGTSTFSSERTGQTLSYVLQLLHVPLRYEPGLNHALRKTGHFFGYAVLSWLLFRAWRATLPSRGLQPSPTEANRRLEWGTIIEPAWRFRWALLAMVVTVLTASVDEAHQFFEPGRTSTVKDVLLDSMGGLFAQCGLLVMAFGRPHTPDR
jgi:VanZ family protein